MAKANSTYTKTTTTKTTTYRVKKGSARNRCPVCGKYMRKKG